MSDITEFKGEHRWCSNFWMANEIINGITFCCNEQWYVWNKCTENGFHAELEINGKHYMNIKDRDALMLLSTLPIDNEKKAVAIKKFGRHNIVLNPLFDRIKLSVMETGLRAKFDQNPDLRQKLIDTFPAMLVEGNTWGDVFWGVDLHTRKGENHLGKLLMKLRDEYRNAMKA